MGRNHIRVGFVGCGRVAENHRLALAHCGQAELVALSSRNFDRARIKADDWGVEAMESPQRMIASDSIDAVFILTPTDSHFSYAEMAIRHGKHVLVEKPVSYRLEEIAELEKLAERFEVRCVPGHSYLYLPEIRRMVRYVKEKRAGTPFYVYISEIYRMPEELIRKYQGPLREVLCHELYILLALLGVPSRVQGFSSRFRDSVREFEEQVAVNLQYSSGTLSHLFLSWVGEDETSDPWTFKLKFLGTNGGFHFSRKDAVTELVDRKPPWEYPLYDEMFEQEVSYFVNECILKGREPLSTLHDAYLALKIMLSVEGSIQEQVVVEISEGAGA